jgi:hypothetical protein
MGSARPIGENVMALKRNQQAVKATVNGFLRDAIRDADIALMRGEDFSPALKAQREELIAIKASYNPSSTKP